MKKSAMTEGKDSEYCGNQSLWDVEIIVRIGNKRMWRRFVLAAVSLYFLVGKDFLQTLDVQLNLSFGVVIWQSRGCV